jgi:hypothetical protein
MSHFKLFIAFLLALSVCCSRQKKDIFNPSPHFLQIERLRKQKPLDFREIENKYVNDLKEYVQERDSSGNSIILNALVSGLQGVRPHVQSQKVSKTLQKVFFNSLVLELKRLDTIKEESGREDIILMINNLYECLAPTVARRSQWIGRQSELDDGCRMAIQGLKNINDRKKSAERLEKYLVQTYVLSVYYELEGIQEARGQDSIKCEEKETEARIFFDIISDYAGNSLQRDFIRGALKQGYRDMTIPILRSALRNAFPGVQKTPAI